MMPMALCSLTFATGLYCVSAKKNLVKVIIGFVIMEYAAVMLLCLTAVGDASYTPPFDIASGILVAGLSGTLLLTAITVRLYRRYGTLDTGEMRKLKG